MKISAIIILVLFLSPLTSRKNISEASVRKLMGENAARLYNIGPGKNSESRIGR